MYAVKLTNFALVTTTSENKKKEAKKKGRIRKVNEIF